jgi:hypothetical protein
MFNTVPTKALLFGAAIMAPPSKVEELFLIVHSITSTLEPAIPIAPPFVVVKLFSMIKFLKLLNL